ncbi:unnamed protein product, partial [Polarella glacialis]
LAGCAVLLRALATMVVDACAPDGTRSTLAALTLSRSTSAGSCVSGLRSSIDEATPAASGGRFIGGLPTSTHTSELPEIMYPVPVAVRNTFVDVAVGRDPSLDGFFQERQVRSCPGSEILGLPYAEGPVTQTPPPEDQPVELAPERPSLLSAALHAWLPFWSLAYNEMVNSHGTWSSTAAVQLRGKAGISSSSDLRRRSRSLSSAAKKQRLLPSGFSRASALRLTGLACASHVLLHTPRAVGMA